VQGDATLEGNEEALSFYNDAVYINQLRHAVRSDGKMSEQRVPYKMREEARMALTDWFADRIDRSLMNQLTGNTTVVDTRYSGNNDIVTADASHSMFPSGVSADASLTASGNGAFTLAMIDTAVVQAKVLSPGIRPIKVGGEDKYVCFIHPYQHYQLRQQVASGQYMDIQKAAIMGGQISKNPIYTGAIAEYNGVILHESNRIPWSNTSLTNGSGTANVARAVLCGAQAAVLAVGKDSDTGLGATWTEELFDYGNQLGVAGGLIYGIKKCQFNSTDFGTIRLSSYSPAPS
jgi:N4-gp56 family major capsid protein